MRHSLYIRHPGFDAVAVPFETAAEVVERAKTALQAGAAEVWSRDNTPIVPALPFTHYSLFEGWLVPERCDLERLHVLIH